MIISKPTRVFIIGSNGQLGQACQQVFNFPDYLVTSFDYPDIDITDFDSLQLHILLAKPDVIINCAAWTAVDLAEAQPDKCFAINAQGPRNIVNAINQTLDYQPILIHVSTDYVFDGCKPLFSQYTEADLPNPKSIYGKSKLEGEIAVLEYPRAAVLRTAWLYHPAGHNFLLTMLKLAKTRNQIKVVNDQFGSPTSALSLAKQIEHLICNFSGGLYHATSQNFCSWFTLAEYLFKQANLSIDLIPISTDEYLLTAKQPVAPRPKNSILENNNLKSKSLDIMPDWHDDIPLFLSLSPSPSLA